MLVKYGGNWIDATVYLTDRIPDEVENSVFSVFKSITYSECKKVPSVKMLKLFAKNLIFPYNCTCLSSWFIHSEANNRILEIVKRLLEAYWIKENELVDYFLFHYFFTYAVQNDDKCKEIFESMPNLANWNPHRLQQVLLAEYDEEVYEEIKQLSSIHKLTYKTNETNTITFLDKIIRNAV